MSKYRVAIIGCGPRGKDHAAAYKFIPEAKLVACCSREQVKADALAQQFGMTAYTSPAQMLREQQVDIVHIATPPWIRHELLSLVSDMGVSLCTTEKPLATGVADWRQIKALAATSKTKFAVSHQYRWHPNLVKCQQALRSGALGDVKFLDLSARMNIAGQGTHTLNYGMSLIGDSPVVQVLGNVSGWTQSDRMHPGADSSAACLTFANGVRGMWTSGNVSPQCGGEQFWKHVRVAAYADRGRVLYEDFGKWEIVGEGVADQGDFGGMEGYQRNNTVAQAEFHKAMIAWYEDPAKVPGTNLKQSLHEWEVILALYQSALDRRPIDMANFNPADDLVDRLIKVLAS